MDWLTCLYFWQFSFYFKLHIYGDLYIFLFGCKCTPYRFFVAGTDLVWSQVVDQSVTRNEVAVILPSMSRGLTGISHGCAKMFHSTFEIKSVSSVEEIYASKYFKYYFYLVGDLNKISSCPVRVQTSAEIRMYESKSVISAMIPCCYANNTDQREHTIYSEFWSTGGPDRGGFRLCVNET